MKEIAEILKQFSGKQKLIVLLVLLSFICGTYIATGYLKTDDCKSVAEENIKLTESLVKISTLVREYTDRQIPANSESADIVYGEMPDTISKVCDTILNIPETKSIDYGLLYTIDEIANESIKK